MKSKHRLVAIIGSAYCTQEESRLAEQVGSMLAGRGITIICGGRGGVMEAACRGAEAAGGLTIGLLPDADPASGNPYLSVVLPTALGHARNALVAQAAHAVIAIGGGYGTLSEIAIALKSGRRVVGLNTWKAQDASGMPLEIQNANSAEEAVAIALECNR